MKRNTIFSFPVRVAPKGGLRFTLSTLAPLAGAFFMRECRGRGGAHNLACAGATPAPATSFQLGGVDTVQRRTWSKAIREAVDRGHAGEVASDSQCTSLRKHFGASEYREVPSAVRRQNRKPVLPCWSSDQPELIISPCWGRSLTPAVRYSSRLHGVLFTSPWPYGEIGRRTVTKPLRDQLLRANGSRVASVAMTCRKPLYTRGDCPSRIGNARSERRGVRVRVPVSAKTGNLFSVFTIQYHPPTSTPALKETHHPSQQLVAGRYMRGGLLGPKQVYLTRSPHKGLREKEGKKRNKQDDRLTQPTFGTAQAGRGMLGNRSNPTPFDC